MPLGPMGLRVLSLLAALSCTAATDEDLTSLLQLGAQVRDGAARLDSASNSTATLGEYSQSAAATVAAQNATLNATANVVTDATASSKSAQYAYVSHNESGTVVTILGQNVSTVLENATNLIALTADGKLPPILGGQHIPSLEPEIPGTDKTTWTGKFEFDESFRNTTAAALPAFLSTCQARFPGDPDCKGADDLLRTMIEATTNTVDLFYLSEWRVKLGIAWYLWFPGPPMSFQYVDFDRDDLLTWSEFVKLMGNETMTGSLPVRKYMDPNGDGVSTRDEIYHFVKYGILIRDQINKVDGYNPSADTAFCLKHAHKFYYHPQVETHLPRIAKGACLLAIAFVTITFIVWAECGFRRSK